jgi:ABC transport system ATP-binding/permease protein
VSSHPAPARLRVDAAGVTRYFDGDRVVIGREADADLVVSHPRASRHHVTIQREGATWAVIDTSSNGTWLQGTRITRVPLPNTPVSIHLGEPSGEEVRLAVVAAEPAAPAGTPQPPRSGDRPLPSSGPVPPTPAHSPPTPAYSPQAPPAPPSPPAGADWWRDLPPPQLPAAGAPADAWQPQQVLPPGHLQHGVSVLPPQVAPGRSISIGRERGNDVVLDDPLVSRHHARLDPGAGGSPAVLHDLGSFNGTFVNGQRLQGSVQLAVGTEVTIGNQNFRWDGRELLASATEHGFTLYAENLTTVVGDGKRLIDNMSFQVKPSSLTAVIGPSGAGKSTLLGALTGLRPASQGRVIWQGHDLYTHYDQLRFQIGLVPQQDIQHPQLKVKQALRYAAQLRLPPDTTPAERDARVQAVAQQMQLTERLDNRIGTQLSGGQKKRVSIATELLTAPPLLFLDEPTSGLDPGLDVEVMRQLRSLADGGRVVMVVTHSVLALDVCDNVMVLAPGGRIAYFGPPAGVLAHFGVANYPEVFHLLESPDLWQRIPAPPAAVGTQPAPAAPVPAPPRQSAGRQFSTLVARNLAVLVSDRLLLGMLLLLPLILGGLSRLVPGDDGLSLDTSERCPPGSETDGGSCLTPAGETVSTIFSVGEPSQRLIVLLVAASLMGTALAIRELVGERSIFRREYAVGLSPGIYFFSKMVVLGTAAFLQGLVVTWIATVGLPGADGAAGTFRVALAIASLSAVMVVVGLALSALIGSSEQAMPALVGVVMVQLVLSGALFEVHGRLLLEQIAWLSPSRWAYAAAASAMDFERMSEGSEDGDWIAYAGAGHYAMDMVMLGLLGLAALGFGLWFVTRSATED